MKAQSCKLKRELVSEQKEDCRYAKPSYACTKSKCSDNQLKKSLVN